MWYPTTAELFEARVLNTSTDPTTKALEIRFVASKLVDYHDQQELPPPRTARQPQPVEQAKADLASPMLPGKSPSERPHQLLLRVEFRSALDFQAIANRGTTVVLQPYFCAQPMDVTQPQPPTLYLNGAAIRADNKFKELAGPTPSNDSNYYFFSRIDRGQNNNSDPPDRGFDLRAAPQDICYYVTGRGASGLLFTSSTTMVPKGAVAAAQLGLTERLR